MYSKYKSKITPLSPVAIRVGQSEVYAPEHHTWGIVTCDICDSQFAIGPNRMWDEDHKEHCFVDRLEANLKQDHSTGQVHLNSYEL